MTDNAKIIQEILNENKIFGEIIEDTENYVGIEITWGDWKHEHCRLRYLITDKMQNIERYEQITTDEDDSDCYSAIHRVYFNKV